MGRRIVRRARPPRYIWQNLPMAERRWSVWQLVLFSVFLTGMPRLSESRKALVSMAATSPEEATAMRDLRISLRLRDQEWPEGSDPCSAWQGVRCENGHVVEVRLSGLTVASSNQRPSSIAGLQHLPLLRLLNTSGFTLVGDLPVWLGDLASLEVIDLMSGTMSGPIPGSFGQLSNLRVLRLANNSLTGAIPASIGNLSHLTLLDLSSNNLEGTIPATLCNLREMEHLNLSWNRLQGRVPAQLGGLSRLQRLLVARNNLVGTIPTELGRLTLLTHLDFSFNSLTGSIPADLGRLAHLTALNLEKNQLVGAIPSQITTCSRLQHLVLRRNGLSGALPQSVGELQRLITLDLSSNNLSGSLPPGISSLMGVESIILSDNSLSGPVPRGLSLLQRLAVLDLSGNFFSGPLLAVPPTRMVMTGRNCFPSSSPSIPQRRASDCSSVYLGISGVQHRVMVELVDSPSSPASSHMSHKRLAAILAGVFAVVLLIVLIAILVFYILQHERKAEVRRRQKRAAAAAQRSVVNKALARKALNIPSGKSINVPRLGDAFSYAQLQNATGQFDLSDMIMAGHTGDLYKGVLDGSIHVVVKRVDVSRFKKDLYMSELDFFGRVAHIRMVPLLGHCLEREDEKLLVYKYMPNGDLAYALHRKDSPSRPEDVLQSLDWITRLKIAIGVAEGLVYLHHDCSPPLVHRDIKASSILLDDKFEVRLGSVTEARVQQGEHHSSILGRFLRLSRSSDQLDTGLPVASCSYDVFCFGKVLLELVSGRLGISGSIDPGSDAWLEWALPLIDPHDREPLTKLMDPSLIVDEDLMEEVWATAIIAKSCLNPKSSRRPNMKHILRALENPQKVVRDDYSGPLKSRHSSYGSWNSALFGGWRHFSSENTFGFYPGSLREEHSSELNVQTPVAAHGDDSARYHRRPESREVLSTPLSGPTGHTHESDETEG